MSKRCTKCGVEKPLSEFYRANGNKDGFNSRCKECKSQEAKEYYKNNRAKQRDREYRTNYKLTLSDYEQILELQKHCCALCGTNDPGGKGRFQVDHNHESGGVRALLCHYCNIGLGHFKDDPQLLEAAAAYLRSHQIKVA